MRLLWGRGTGLPRAAVVLIALTLVTQILSVLHPAARPPILGISLLILDPLGVVYAWRASRRGHSTAPTWRLVAYGRLFSTIATLTFAASALAHERKTDPGAAVFDAWWWLAVSTGLLVFLSLSAAALSISTRRLVGSQRGAFIAELGTVLSSGFMLIWYFALNPALSRAPTVAWYYELGFPIGNLILLSAVAAVLIRGAVARLRQPSAVLLAGMLLYSLGDAAFSAAHVQNLQPGNSALSCAALVLASLLMTVAAMQQSTAVPDGRPAPARMPAWSAHLPYVAVAAGNTLLLVFTVREGRFLLWGGLILGQTAMTAALAVRQIISLRDSRRQTVVDALTGLANITGLRQAMAQAERRRDASALMLIDLDGFKLINDGYGHDVGDRILVEFSRLLRDTVRRDDVPARVGGDEFVVLFDGAAGEEQAIALAERLLAELAGNPVVVGGGEITIRCSIGLAAGRPGEPADDLRRRADLAMYESKRSGTHGWRSYEPSMTDRRSREAQIGDKLLPGLAAGQFDVVYQPIVDMTTGRVTAAEALLRWNHPTLGEVPPLEFIPIAERTGAIIAIGHWVLAEACAQAQRWREAGLDLRVNVNVAVAQLQHAGFGHDVDTVLAETGLPAGRLTLEITESAMVDEEMAIPALEALRGRGIPVALDDFGTGYSSLRYLARLPVEILKIDRAFVAELDSTTRGAAVAEAVIRLGQILGLAVVAEGVETAAQAAELQMLGCSTAQGYLFHRPMTAAALTATVSAELPAP